MGHQMESRRTGLSSLATVYHVANRLSPYLPSRVGYLQRISNCAVLRYSYTYKLSSRFKAHSLAYLDPYDGNKVATMFGGGRPLIEKKRAELRKNTRAT